MTRKKLPKAVRQTADDMRMTSEAERVTPSLPIPAGNKVGDASESRSLTATPNGIDAKRRLVQANAIVERYANLAVLGGAIPLPLVNVAALTTLVVRMVKLLCRHYGVPYEHGRARALVVAVAAGSIPTTASAITTSTLVYFIPGVNLLGLAVSSVTASVCTRGIGKRVVEHFETGGTLLQFPVIDRR